MADLDLEKKMSELVDTHSKAMHDLRDANDKLLLESKTELGKTNDTIEKIQNSLDEIEKKYFKLEKQKSLFEQKSDFTAEQLEYKNLFNDYIRKGMDVPDEVKAKLIAGDASLGGYLCDEPMEKGIRKDVTELNMLRQYARVMTIGTRSTSINVRTGKVTAYWTGEQGDVQKSAQTYGSERIECHGLDVTVPISVELLQDSNENMESEIRMDTAEAFAEAEGIAFITGDGVTKPTGILSTTTIGRVTSGTSGAVKSDDIIALMFELKTAYIPNAMFACNRKILRAVRQLKDTTNQYIFQTAQDGKIQFNLMNTPVIELPAMTDTVSANNEIMVYGDFKRGYRIVDLSLIHI